ncbi:MAG: xylose isomerase [Muricauda sp.]|nr:sugar phosphate isomerase/epimerase [Allomuricauda sp.]MAU26988.1 xylose isomerase [Allomuricauda sp.]MBC31708.1 xylose isomerase [Allomuricauda sp.]|tara:strand:- start:1009 stop:1974 length:966 start_codon:yes stop_codon:yes gene_type:complete
MKRNTFLQHLGLLSMGGTLLPHSMFGQLNAEPKLLEAIGIQLFSLPFLLEKDFRQAIAMLSRMGYKEIEMYGPYPFSSEAAHQRWNAVTPHLGFSGSGYFGLSEKEVKAILDEHGITVPAMHTDLVTLENHAVELGKAAKSIGFKYIGLPAIPDERRKTLDDYKKMADTFNAIGEQAQQEGLMFYYHNHGYGLNEIEGQIPFEVLIDNTDPDLVFLEMDLFWTLAGKANPIDYLKKYSGRYHLMHVKDMKEQISFSGDGGNSSQWIELFPNMTTVGNGVVDFNTIIPIAKENGVKHFFVEQDMVQNPEIALKKSFDYLSSL